MKEPKIRFKGFKGEWEKKKLGAMTSVRGGYAFQSSLFQKSGIPVVRISNILSNGNIGGDFAYYPQIDGDSNITLHDKDVVIAMSGATTGKIARVDVGDEILYQNQRVGLFTKTGKVDYDFLYAVLNRPHFNELLNKLLTSSAQPNASSADIESIEMGFPEDAEEQKALSNYILSLDALIQSTTKKIESLKQVKAASLQSMFPQEGETTPRVRFKGFEGEWETDSIENIAIIIKGEQINKSELSNYGTYYVLNGGVSPSGYTEKFNTKSNTISISEGGNSCGYVSYNNQDFWSGGHNYTLQNVRINNNFLFAYLKSKEYEIMSKRVGSGLPNIQKKSLQVFLVHFPLDGNEQRAIASFFTNLDRQITLQTQRLEKLKQIKAACLDNMFV